MGFDSRKGRGKRIFEEIPRFEFGHRIPKTIHQIFFSDKPIPPLLRQNIDRIKGFHDGWKHALYDHGDIVEFIRSAYGPEVLRYYEKINEKYGAARADLFRYLLMYKCGGVYLDIKASVESSLDDYLLPDDEYLLCRWRNKSGEEFERWGVHSRLRKAGGSEFQQWHIIAAPGHPFLRAVIEKVLHNIDNYNPVLHQTGRAGVLGVTGPIAYTLAIAPLLKEHKHRLVDDHRSLGLEYNIILSKTGLSHTNIFKHHYSDLTEPVTNLDGWSTKWWTLFRPFHVHIVRRSERLRGAIANRMRRWRLRIFRYHPS